MIDEPEIGWFALLEQTQWIINKIGKIKGIVHVRAHTGCSLKDGKDFVDLLFQWAGPISIFPAMQLPLVHLSYAKPAYSNFAQIKKAHEQGKLNKYGQVKWDHPNANPLKDVAEWQNKSAPKLKRSGPNRKLAVLVQMYNPNEKSLSALHHWAQQVMTELSKLD